jgi:hypothetical protein
MEIKKKSNYLYSVNVRGIFRDAITGRITGQFAKHNLSVDSGLYAIAARLAGGDSPITKGTITYCGVGTGVTAPDHADTKLETEIFRKQISVRSSALGVAKFRTFFNTSEANDTLKEVGLFGDDASAVADSGTLFCRLAINEVKTAAETLTLDWEVTVSAAP